MGVSVHFDPERRRLSTENEAVIRVFIQGVSNTLSY